MSDTLLDSYPAFTDQGRLHLVPSGARAYLAIPRGERIEPQDADLDHWATRIAMQMDGSNTVRSLCETAIAAPDGDGTPKPADIAIAGLVELINGLVERSIVELREGHAPRPIRTSGAHDRYSPVHASIELTDYCNIMCRHCYRDSSPMRTSFIPTDKLLSWLEEFRQVGIGVVELTGGEPTSHPAFGSFLQRCGELFQITAVISNGTLWTDELLDIPAKFKDRIFIQIDLDGSNAESHDFLRGAGVFAKATQTIRQLADRGVKCRVAMSVHGRNAHEIMDTARLAKSLGAFWFGFAPVMQLGRGHHAPPLLPEHGHHLKHAQEALASELPGFYFAANDLMQSLSKPGENCGAGWRGIVVGPDGRVRACLTHRVEYMDFGKLDDIGLDGVLKAIPGEALRSVPSPNLMDCAGCMHLVFCAGCAARAMQAIEFHRGKNDGFVCNWDKKYDAVKVYAPNMYKMKPKSSLKRVDTTAFGRVVE
ncbi:MAG: radical SAM protein [Hyphomonadaceae bacterium]|jgi:radical SAM protein with 4Fe4S-binding SPASM domain|nr:radical SAM protein [Hyphomonadaceae bacterium]